MCGCTTSSDATTESAAVGGDNEELLESQLYADDGLCTTTEIHVSCQNLADKDVFSKSDPFAVLYFKNKKNGQWVETGRTEVIDDNLNPVFVKSIIVKYFFEERQPMRFEVYDADDKKDLRNLKKQEFIGAAEFALHEAIRAKDQILRLPLVDKGKSNGTIILHAEEVKEKLSSNLAHMTIECYGAVKNSPMFYRLLRSDGNSFFPVYQSEACRRRNGNIKWHKVKIPTAGLFRDDQSKPLRIELYEYFSNGNHKLLETRDFQFVSIIDGFKWESKVGVIVFKDVSVEKRASFLEYLFGGCQISLAIAIDFTASNNDPDMPNSLHSTNLQKNQYVQAIRG
eukprot:TRINITY_DN388_c0_g1_i9.p2 TRINITY_DN388_c0_g1~~TRINITY_DN388_c0_g1_i9.p2  ORF type:complete len:340 (-),score=79.69 TRINITY_DN388_c0_g1_i9:863-1882(-)